MNVSTPLLQAFVALEETLSFSQAAERCHLTQSAFSQMIRRLESAVGTRLFHRHTRAVRLTPEGAVFSPRARRILLEIQSTAAEMRDYAQGRKGKLAIAIQPSLAASWLPRVLDEYVGEHPGVSIEVFDTWPERALQLLQEGRVELAVATEPGASGEADVRLLFREPFLLACSTRHALARKRVLNLGHLKGLPMIYPIHIGGTRVRSGNAVHKLGPLMHAAGVKETGIEVENIASVAALVAAGIGVSLVPQLARAMVTSAGVSLVPIARGSMQREVYLSTRTKSSLSVAATAFVAVIDRQGMPKELESGS